MAESGRQILAAAIRYMHDSSTHGASYPDSPIGQKPFLANGCAISDRQLDQQTASRCQPVASPSPGRHSRVSTGSHEWAARQLHTARRAFCLVPSPLFSQCCLIEPGLMEPCTNCLLREKLLVGTRFHDVSTYRHKDLACVLDGKRRRRRRIRHAMSLSMAGGTLRSACVPTLGMVSSRSRRENSR